MVLSRHEQLLAEFGGSGGMRNEGLLDSALGYLEKLVAYGQLTFGELAAS